jgi:broad specificity phosphatase PhoE
MAEIILVRHAKAYANLRDFTAAGNEKSEVEPAKGRGQAIGLGRVFREKYHIDPVSYPHAVAASEYTRTQQTAELAGFRRVHIHPILNESVFDREGLNPEEVKLKHVQERWVPGETAERAERFVELIRKGDLEYQIFFSHGIFIAGVMLHLADEANVTGAPFPHEFTEERGFIPRNAETILATV